MNLADPELELIDPTPNVHALFIQFDHVFFWEKLVKRAVVRWSKRMYSCAGICSYEGRGGLCDIALSEPLLKLRPRKDLIETLLHEMIHAFLFITCRDQDRDGHGPNFKEHMYRINKAAGLNISIYHDFHDEVRLYQTHWWRCKGPCQLRKPYFGVVRRSQNRAPGPNDSWWSTHQKTCGGTFVKIKEPEKKSKKATEQNKQKKVGDITKYVKTVNGTNSKVDNIRKPLTPLVKNKSGGGFTNVKSNGGNTLVITQKTKSVTNSPISKPSSSQPPPVFSGKPHTIDGGRKRSNSVDVVETVRNVWLNKQLPGLSNSKSITPKRKSISSSDRSNNNTIIKSNNLKVEAGSPPAKIKKIDDYFKNSATSILKDVYGEDFALTQKSDNKIVAKKVNLVDCPICSARVDSGEINRHLDECLNRDVIEKLSKDSKEIIDSQTPKVAEKHSKDADKLLKISSFNSNDHVKMIEISDIKPIIRDATVNLTDEGSNYKSNESEFVSINPQKAKKIVKMINLDKQLEQSVHIRKVKEEATNVNSGVLPSMNDNVSAIKPSSIKIEPGTSKEIVSIISDHKCPCCGYRIDVPMAEHLDECLSFFDNNTTTPEEGASTSFANDTIVIDDEDDIFDETLTLNATGTKTPCPCCLQMIEMAAMNAHLDDCLN